MSQTEKINRFSEASQKLLKDMDQTEIFELCENSTKLQCPDCDSFTEIGIVYFTCGRNLKFKRSLTTFEKDNNDFNSTHGLINEKNSTRGHELHYIFVRLKRVCHLVRTCLTLCCSPAVHHEHIFFLTHPSFYHDTKTRTTIGTTRSTPRNTQCIINLCKHARSKSIAITNHSGVKTSRVTEPRAKLSSQPKELATKELATVSRISRITDPHYFYDVQKEIGEQGHRAPITEEVKEFGEFGNPVSIDSKLSETSCFLSHMHFDDSAESIADSDPEDGKSDFATVSTESVWETRCNGRSGERRECTNVSLTKRS